MESNACSPVCVYTSQSCNSSPGTRLKSTVFRVTTIILFVNPIDAIRRSMRPIRQPSDRSLVNSSLAFSEKGRSSLKEKAVSSASNREYAFTTDRCDFGDAMYFNQPFITSWNVTIEVKQYFRSTLSILRIKASYCSPWRSWKTVQ